MIVIIGSVNMDLVLRVPRMPMPGETLAGDKFMTIPGGKGANQAVACARLAAPGTSVAMVACVGDDAFGSQMRDSITACGIDDRHIDESRAKPPASPPSWSTPTPRTASSSPPAPMAGWMWNASNAPVR
jgi:sugar/nucleoside kinase (ribokinase family)